MALYLSIVAIGSILLFSFDLLIAMPIFGFTPWYLIAAIVVAVAYQFAVDGIVAFFICRLPDKWFHKDKKIFAVSPQCFWGKKKLCLQEEAMYRGLWNRRRERNSGGHIQFSIL